MKLLGSGSWKKTFRFLKNVSQKELTDSESKAIRSYADNIITQLAEATPKDSGKTAASWSYKVSNRNGKVRLDIYNSNINDGACIAILLQYGHATNGGGYVPGIDYINPVIKPMFNRIQETAWMEVIR